MPSGPAFRPSDATKSFPAALRVTMVILAADRRERTARINRVMYHEGDEIAPGVTLEEIAASAIVIWYQGRRFRLVL